MDREIKNGLETCFSRGRSPADCYGALSFMKENPGRVNYNDDSDMCDMIEIILRALKLDKGNV